MEQGNNSTLKFSTPPTVNGCGAKRLPNNIFTGKVQNKLEARWLNLHVILAARIEKICKNNLPDVGGNE